MGRLTWTGTSQHLMTDVLKDIEVLVRRYPWPTLLYRIRRGLFAVEKPGEMTYGQ